MTADASPVDTSPAGITATVRAVWDSAAAGGHRYGDLDATDAQRRAWTMLLRRLLPATEPLHVLEVGSGAGFLSLVLAELGHTVTALDLSPGMVVVARAAVAEAGASGVRVVEGEATLPPEDLGTFDVVVSRYLLWTLPDPQAALGAWSRLVRPGGRVIGIDALRSEDLVRATVGEEYPPEVLRLLPLLHARDLDPLHNLWRRAGLEDVMVEELAWIDEVVRTEAVVHLRPMLRRFGHYLVEGTRPHPPR